LTGTFPIAIKDRKVGNFKKDFCGATSNLSATKQFGHDDRRKYSSLVLQYSVHRADVITLLACEVSDD
jgi:hypothetical protein